MQLLDIKLFFIYIYVIKIKPVKVKLRVLQPQISRRWSRTADFIPFLIAELLSLAFQNKSGLLL